MTIKEMASELTAKTETSPSGWCIADGDGDTWGISRSGGATRLYRMGEKVLEVADEYRLATYAAILAVMEAE